MTQPGVPIPPQPGWWERTVRIGTAVPTFGWSAHAVGVTPAIGGTFNLHLAPSLGMSAAERYARAVGLTLTPALGMSGAERYIRSFIAPVIPAVGMTGAEQYARTLNLAATAAIGMTGGTFNPAAFALPFTPSLGIVSVPAATIGLSLTPTIGMTGSAAVTYDSTGAGFKSTSASNLTWTQNIAGNFVVAAVQVSGAAVNLSATATVGTTPMAQTQNFLYYDQFNFYYLFVFILFDPPTGSQTISVTLSAANRCAGNSVSYSGVHSLGPAVQTTLDAASGTSQSLTVTGTTTADQIAQMFGTTSASPAYSAYNQTQRYNDGTSVSSPMVIGDAAGGASVTFSATGGSGNYGAAAVSLLSAPSPGPQVRGAISAPTTSVPIPGHQAGDLIIIIAYANNSNTIPTQPSAGGTVPTWTTIDSQGINTNAIRISYAVATASNHTSGVWTTSAQTVAMVIRGQGATPIGGYASGNGNTATPAAPAITPINTDGTSTLLYIYCIGGTGTAVWPAAPTGFTQIHISPGNNRGVIIHTKNDSTSDGAQTLGNAGLTKYLSETIEVRSH